MTVLAALIAAGAAIVALTGGRGHAPATVASSLTPAPAAGGATSTRVATAPRRAEQPATAGPTTTQQADAVARVRESGVPVYRTPGKGGNLVALTFDDGPGPYTRTTIETLARYGMRATFFLCGSTVERFPAEPARERTVGAVGDHTWSHPSLPSLTAAQATSEIARTKVLVERTSGAPVLLFRPPYGARTPAIDATARRLGMIDVLWSIDSRDSAGAGWQEMLQRIEATIAPGDIVLFHENRGQTQKVINRLLPWMRKRGMRSVSIPELLALDPPSGGYLRTEAGRNELAAPGGG